MMVSTFVRLLQCATLRHFWLDVKSDEAVSGEGAKENVEG